MQVQVPGVGACTQKMTKAKAMGAGGGKLKCKGALLKERVWVHKLAAGAQMTKQRLRVQKVAG